MSAAFPIIYQLRLEGAAQARRDLDTLVEQFQRGEVSIKEVDRSLRSLDRSNAQVSNSANRMVNAWRVAHPTFNLFERTLGRLSSVARSFINIFNSLNLLRIREQTDPAVLDLRRLEDELEKARRRTRELEESFGPEHPLVIEAKMDLTRLEAEISAAKTRIAQLRVEAKIQLVFIGFEIVTTGLTAIETAILARAFLGAVAVPAFVLPVLAIALPILIQLQPEIQAGLEGGVEGFVNKFIERSRESIENVIRNLRILFSPIIEFDIGDLIEIVRKRADEAVKAFIEGFAQIPGLISNIFLQALRLILDRLDELRRIFQNWVDALIGIFEALRHAITGGSIVPDMMREITQIFGSGLAETEGLVGRWKGGVISLLGDALNILHSTQREFVGLTFPTIGGTATPTITGGGGSVSNVQVNVDIQGFVGSKEDLVRVVSSGLKEEALRMFR